MLLAFTILSSSASSASSARSTSSTSNTSIASSTSLVRTSVRAAKGQMQRHRSKKNEGPQKPQGLQHKNAGPPLNNKEAKGQTQRHRSQKARCHKKHMGCNKKTQGCHKKHMGCRKKTQGRPNNENGSLGVSTCPVARQPRAFRTCTGLRTKDYDGENDENDETPGWLAPGGC